MKNLINEKQQYQIDKYLDIFNIIKSNLRFNTFKLTFFNKQTSFILEIL